jgi:hypothetical protein
MCVFAGFLNIYWKIKNVTAGIIFKVAKKVSGWVEK